MIKSGVGTDTIHKVYELIYRGGVLKYLDRAKWGISEVAVESIITDLTTKYGCLLIGSPTFLFAGDYLELGVEGKLFATDHAGVAILKAIFSKEFAKLYFGWFVDEQHPLRLDIVRSGPGEIVHKCGYVYVLKTRHGFELDPPTSNWSWSSTSLINELGGCIEVRPSDFNYPVCGPLNLYREF